MMPCSTARLQVHAGFPLSEAMRHVPYYASLGISHLYLSPVSCARAGSSHGYDVVDHRRVDPQLGGEDALKELARCVRDHGMGIILDIVPNHMAAHPDNPWWHSVLQCGPQSPYAQWFDIQWDTVQPGLQGKLLLPILPDMYGVALERGDIRLVVRDGRYGIDVGGQMLPLAAGSLRPGDDTASCDASSREGRKRLHALLQRQHYRLAWWQCAAEQINWRRFFEISDLAGLCVERDDVFDAVHALPLRLFEQGLIDGLRIDHVDGLAQPLTYCSRLLRELGDRIPARPAMLLHREPWLIVEKILARGEYLEPRWCVHGTTGYDFMEAVNTVMHDAIGEAPLTHYWNNLSRDRRPLDAWRRDARTLMVTRHFAAERDVLLDKICSLAQRSPATRDATRHSLGQALDQLLIEFPVYRSYATQDNKTEADVRYLKQTRDEAVRQLLARRERSAARSLGFIVHWLKGGESEERSEMASEQGLERDNKGLQAEVMRRFQQLTPPLAAKALEDTVFYRYGRLLSRNEVGSDPAVFSIPPDDFHDWVRHRMAITPHSMNATATHDHKRGEDVRARLTVLSEVPFAWQEVSTRCLAALGQQSTIDSGAEAAQCYMLLQTIVGAWPPDLRADDEQGMTLFIERLQQWQLKALREAKQKSSWFCPDETSEQMQADRIGFLLGDPESPSCKDLAGFVNRIAVPGALNSLAYVVLRCTLPGVPDLYQGTELWDFSLVDPDNRRRVDMTLRETRLCDLARSAPDWSVLLQRWPDGAIKQAVLSSCLHVRLQYPAVFTDSRYEPLVVNGPLSLHVLAFARHAADHDMIVVVSRLSVGAVRSTGQTMEVPLIPPDAWQDTRIMLPSGGYSGRWRDALSGRIHAAQSSMRLEAVLDSLPVAVLVTL